MSWLSLIPLGVETLGNLGGGIYNAATADDRKRKWKKEQKRNALFDLERNYAAEMGMPTYDLDAMRTNQQIDQQADEQFKIDPMTFVPFVKSASRLADKIYGEAQTTPEEKQEEAEKQRQIRASLNRPSGIAQTIGNREDALERAESLKYFQPYGRY